MEFYLCTALLQSQTFFSQRGNFRFGGDDTSKSVSRKVEKIRKKIVFNYGCDPCIFSGVILLFTASLIDCCGDSEATGFTADESLASHCDLASLGIDQSTIWVDRLKVRAK